MPLPPIVVAIAPADAAPELRQALLDACTRAAEEVPCVEATPGGATAHGTATVSWPDAARARIEVSLGADGAPVVRNIAFGAGDAPEERWRAIGLVVGTLAGTAARIREERDEVAVPEEPIPKPPAPVLTLAPPLTAANAPLPDARPVAARPPANDAPPPVRRGAKEPWHASLELASVVGSALDRGAPRIGAEVGGRLEFPEELLQLSAGAAYSEGATRDHGLRTRFLEGAAGGGFSQSLGSTFTGGARVEGLCQRFEASLVRPEAADGGTASRARWLGGVRVGADVHYWPLARLGAFVEAAGQWVAGSTNVDADGTRVGGASAVGYVVNVGAAFRVR